MACTSIETICEELYRQGCAALNAEQALRRSRLLFEQCLAAAGEGEQRYHYQKRIDHAFVLRIRQVQCAAAERSEQARLPYEKLRELQQREEGLCYRFRLGREVRQLRRSADAVRYEYAILLSQLWETAYRVPGGDDRLRQMEISLRIAEGAGRPPHAFRRQQRLLERLKQKRIKKKQKGG